MPLKKLENRIKPGVELAKVDAIKTLVEIQDRVEELVEREGKVSDEEMPKLVEGLKVANDKLAEHDRVIKANTRTLGGDGALSIPYVQRLVPEDTRIDRTFFNLMQLTPHELRFGAAAKDMPKGTGAASMQATARAAEDYTDSAIRELQRLNDEMFIADMLLSGKGDTPYARLSLDPGVRMKSLKSWARWEKLSTQFQRDLITTTTTLGGNWIPTQLSARLFELIQPELRVAALFQSIDMPNKVFELPVMGADMIAYLIAEAQTISTSDITTNKTTFTAVKLATRTLASTEVLEDTAIAMEPMVTAQIAKSISRGIEDAIINGDTAGSHQDSDVTSGADRRKAWDGLRKHGLISSMPKVDLSTFTSTTLLSMKSGMGTYGVIPSQGAWIVGFKGYIKLMDAGQSSQPSMFLTRDKYSSPTLESGEIGQMFGSPVVLTEFMRENLNASGVYDGTTTTKTAMFYVNREGFALGRRRDISISRSAEQLIDKDQIVFTGTWRGHFRDVYATAGAANKTVSVGYNFA